MSLIANEDPNLAESRFDRISNAPPTNYAVQLSGINRKFLSFSFLFHDNSIIGSNDEDKSN